MSGYATSVNVDDAISWLENQDDEQSWLLWLAFNASHSPYHLPPADLHGYSHLSGATEDINGNPGAYYRAAIEALDTEVGRLLTWLHDNGQQDVSIIFLGDNGTPPEVVGEPYDRNKAKGSLYQGGIHVPLCIAGPAVVEGNRQSQALVHAVDLYATVLALLGYDTAAGLPEDWTFDTVSLLPYLADSAAPEQREWVFSQAFDSATGDRNGWTVRDGSHKLIRFEDGNEELYAISSDPHEEHNLLAAGPLTDCDRAQYEALVARLESLLATE